jgi:hypothetical protein
MVHKQKRNQGFRRSIGRAPGVSYVNELHILKASYVNEQYT